MQPTSLHGRDCTRTDESLTSNQGNVYSRSRERQRSRRTPKLNLAYFALCTLLTGFWIGIGTETENSPKHATTGFLLYMLQHGAKKPSHSSSRNLQRESLSPKKNLWSTFCGAPPDSRKSINLFAGTRTRHSCDRSRNSTNT